MSARHRGEGGGLPSWSDAPSVWKAAVDRGLGACFLDMRLVDSGVGHACLGPVGGVWRLRREAERVQDGIDEETPIRLAARGK